MELKERVKGFTEYIKSYKYVAIIVIAGILMMLIPSMENKTAITETVNNLSQQDTFEDRLCKILSSVSGAGKVEVMLSLKEGEEIIYQTDENVSTGGSTETNNKKVVTVTDAQRNQNGLIKQRNPESYQGVIIVCQGAENPAVRLDLINAVSKLTGLGSDRISVLKMK